MANKKISELNELTSPTTSDVIPIVDDSETETKKITAQNFKKAMGTEYQTAENKAVFNGVTSYASASTFTSFNGSTIYLDLYWDGVSSENQYLFIGASNVYRYGIATDGDVFAVVNGDLVRSTPLAGAGYYKIIFWWNGSSLDIIVNGVKLGLTDTCTTQPVFTGITLGGDGATANHFDGSYYDVRVSSATITEAQALAITAGTSDIDDYLTTANTQLIYESFDSTSTFDNKGTLGASGDLTATDVIKGNFTEFEILNADNIGMVVAYRNSGAVTIPTASATKVSLDTAMVIDESNFEITSGNVKVLKSGYYIISGIINLTSGTASSEVQLRINADVGFLLLPSQHMTSTQAIRVAGTTMAFLDAGDQLFLSVYQDSGVSKTCDDDFYECQLALTRVK